MNKLLLIQCLSLIHISGNPASIKRLLCKPIEDIITYGNQVLRGLVNNNQGCRNYYDMHRIQYIIQYSIAYTIARKCDISIKKVFKKHHTQLIYSYMNDRGEAKTIRLALYPSFKRDKTFFPQWLRRTKQDVEYRYRDTNPLKRNCYIGGKMCIRDSSHTFLTFLPISLLKT